MYSFHLMLLTDTDEMYELWLPQAVQGFLRFTDEPEYRFLSVSGQNGRWIASCRKPAFFQNMPWGQSGEVVLRDGQMLEIGDEDKTCSLYVETVLDQHRSSYYRHVERGVSISIGNLPDSDICYDNPYITGRHAVLRRDPENWMIWDCGSTYGVYVNGKKVSSSILKLGDVVSVLGMRIIIGADFLSVVGSGGKVSIRSERLREHADNRGGYSRYYSEEIPEPGDGFFNRTPRKRVEMNSHPIVVEGPPMSMDQKQLPLMLRLGSSVIRGGTAALAGNFTTLISSVLFPFLSTKFTEKQREEYEQLRYSKYTEYLYNKQQDIANACQYEREFLNKKYPTIDSVMEKIQKKAGLWERRPVDDDFLHIRLGSGARVLSAPIEYPARRFELETDELEERMYQLVEQRYSIDNMPVILSLGEAYVCGVIGKRKLVLEFLSQLVLQTAMFHSYDEVKMVFLLKREELAQIEDIRYLPHAWDDQKTIRFIATNEAEAYTLGEYIQEQIFDSGESGEELSKILKRRPFYMVFALDKKLLESHETFGRIIRSDYHPGAAVITMFGDLPKEAQKIVTLSPYGKNLCTTMGAGGGEDAQFITDAYDREKGREVMRMLANTSLKTAGREQELPKTVTFLEMFRVGRVEQLNPLKRWRENDPTKSLAAPVGVGADGALFMLDLHEKRQGPHGLVAGMTGSGKSEFIITYILSMAVNYHPDEVALVLIDYKGGGLADAFENPRTGVRLPHLAGTITNLDGASIQRSLMSIESELIRRQKVFSEISKTFNEGSMNIYTYQSMYRAGKVSEPMPHLFIVSDEFAELKQQQPEFMDKLISAARIGRSLGIHLILATQKPSGVVNDQIRSNTKFRVCLRVQERSDSMDMLKRPEAAELTDTGRFYLQVGYNEYFALGQSAWGGADYEPQDTAVVRKDDAIEFLDTTGQVVSRARPKVKKTASGMKQVVAVVEHLSALAEGEGIIPHILWKEPLPQTMDLEDLHSGFERVGRTGLEAMVGMIDDPESQSQYPLVLELHKYQHMLVAGSAGSGKTTLIKTLLHTLSKTYSPKDVNYYIIDFSGGALSVFKDAPHCGAFLTETNEDAIERFFRMLREIIRERRTLFNKAGVANYEAYIQEKALPLIFVVIDNYSGFSAIKNGSSYYSSFHEYLKDAVSVGIKILVSCSNLNEISSRSKQEFGYRIALNMKDRFAYAETLNCKTKLIPPALPGRGLCVCEGRVLEYQIAVPFSKCSEQERTLKIMHAARQSAGADGVYWPVKKLPVITENETYEAFGSDVPNGHIPLGYDLRDVKKVSLPLAQLYCMAVYFGNMNGVGPVLKNFIQASRKNEMDLIVLKRMANSIFGRCPELAVDPNIVAASKEASVQLCKRLIEEVKLRKVFRNEYCSQNGIPIETAKSPEVLRKAAPYIRQHTKPLLILIEDFQTFSTGLQDDCRNLLEDVFEHGRGYNMYFISCFYPESKTLPGTDLLAKIYLRDALMLFFGGQYHSQALCTMPLEFRKVTESKDAYNEFVLRYNGKFYNLVMPCGMLAEDETDVDERPIIQ